MGSGRLTRALEFSGFGDLQGSVLRSPAPRRKAAGPPVDLEKLEEEAHAAADALRDAKERLEEAQAAHKEARLQSQRAAKKLALARKSG